MKILTIGTDRKLFEEGSAVRARAVEYAGLFDELHIVVFSKRKSQIQNPKSQKNSNVKIQISKNCWVYPTNSLSRWFYILDAIRIGRRVIENCKLPAGRSPGAGGEIENSGNDFVVSGQDPFECGLAACKLAKRFKLPLHVQIHVDFLNPFFAAHSFLNRIRVRISRKVLPQANAIRVVSQRIKVSLEASSLKLKTVPVVLPIWTDLKRFETGKPATDLRQKYSQWHFIILMVARLSPEKNVGFALRLLKELLKKYPKIGLVVVGDGPELRNLQLTTYNLQLGEHVAFEGAQKDVVSYYKTANLFLQTSLYEGFGLALLEAVASGCPSVSSDVGIAPELLNQKDHSFVCPVNNLDCFIRTVSGLVEDNRLRTFFSLEIAPLTVAPFTTSKGDYLATYKASLEAAAV